MNFELIAISRNDFKPFSETILTGTQVSYVAKIDVLISGNVISGDILNGMIPGLCGAFNIPRLTWAEKLVLRTYQILNKTTAFRL